jgi:hypothetical protein
MKKPCKLAILKRSIAKPDFVTQDCQPSYWGGLVDGKPNWVFFESNALLLNRRDATKDLLENPQFVEANQISWCEALHETHFELVELIEKTKSFGWTICQLEQNSKKRYYLSAINLMELSDNRYKFVEHPSFTIILDEEQKNDVMTELAKIYPDIQFKAIELFTE